MKRPNTSCQHCGASIKQPRNDRTKKFCNNECRTAWNAMQRELRRANPIPNAICQHCGEKYPKKQPDQKYCSHACAHEARHDLQKPWTAVAPSKRRRNKKAEDHYTDDNFWKAYKRIARELGITLTEEPTWTN